MGWKLRASPHFFIMVRKEIFIDTETTGDNRFLDNIWQVSAIVVIDGIEREQRTWNMCPLSLKPEFINEEMLKDKLGITLDEIRAFDKANLVILSFIDFLGQYVDHENEKDKFFFIAFNSRFDIDFIGKWFIDCNKKRFFFNNFYAGAHICVSALSAFVLQKFVPKLPNFKLTTIAELFEIEIEVHQAESDIRATYEIYKQITKAINIDYNAL